MFVVRVEGEDEVELGYEAVALEELIGAS